VPPRATAMRAEALARVPKLVSSPGAALMGVHKLAAAGRHCAAGGINPAWGSM